MYLQVAGHLIVIHTPSAPGLFSLGAVYFPPVGGDFSQVPLTCMPHLTAHTFYNNGENVNLAMRDGAIFDYASMFIYMGMVGSEQDQVGRVMQELIPRSEKEAILQPPQIEHLSLTSKHLLRNSVVVPSSWIVIARVENGVVSWHYMIRFNLEPYR